MNNRDVDRFNKALELIENKDYLTVLDLGCRDKILKDFLKNDIKYTGVDYDNDDEVIAHNLENTLPFEDSSFDIVFALDVLEHVENIHLLLDEVIRVSKREIIIALPNMYYWKFRLRYLKGKDISDKYLFTENTILDRHRWITSHDSSVRFIESNTKDYKIKIKLGFYQYKSNILKFIDKFFSKRYPNLFSYTIFFHIHKL
jgi:2-polyprenyl-3-methyl-5-hydroxy-6-metoxy-1,4-benzoquinol methylase